MAVLLNLSFVKGSFTTLKKTISIVDTIADHEFHQAWLEFSKAILNQDLKSIKALSSDCILCPDCVVNTP